ncbi:MAG TPA: PAS domain S-box protein [Burkholderiales bacterium]|nr:PAS domain S-box protein [Burkholderiales bacterium]
MVQPYETLLDAIDAGLIVLDRQRRIVRWNTWMATASGYHAGDVHGKTLEQVFPEANLALLAAAIGSALASGASTLLTHVLHPTLLPLRTRAGRTLLHDVTVSAVGDRADAACLVHIADVTMATRRERFLRDRQNARYDAVVASAPDSILTLDSDGVIRQANPSAIAQFAHVQKQLVGTNAALLFAGQTAWSDAWRAVLKGSAAPGPVELVTQRQDGALGYFEVSLSRWQTDSRVFVTAIFRDTTDRRAASDALATLNTTLEQRVEERTARLMEAEEALRQSQKMEAIGQLTGGIAHDFNNLLQGIIGALDMVQKRVTEGRINETSRFLKAALTSAERASSLTHRLLAFSRRQPVDPRPLAPNDLIASTEELLRRSIGEGIKMTIQAADDLWLIRCDANQLENALLNLAINARDAMAHGGTLTITTCNKVLNATEAALRDVKAGDYVCITVRDTGMGMPAEVQSRAFDPFYTTKPIGQGTGLGLSMIYGFVRQSNGGVRIESKVGIGTAVEISLPRFIGDLDPLVSAAPTDGDSQLAAGEVVLVVEDEDVVRLLVAEVLGDLGFRALEATDGPSAVRILQSSQRIDLLITDIGLPDVDGRQVADAGRIKRPHLKVLFMTGYAETAASDEILDKGMELISKPFTMDSLSAKIRQMMERHYK